MGGRFWIVMLIRLVVAALVIGWFASYLRPEGGDKEFQAAVEAMKQIHSMRVAFTSNNDPAHPVSRSWEVVCSQHAYHYVEHSTDDPKLAATYNHDEFRVGTITYAGKDGGWQLAKNSVGMSADDFCTRLANGQEAQVMPPFTYMVSRAVIQKGSKKTVNGVRCRDWNVAIRSGPAGIEHDTICLGVDDHLPYERTIDWQHSRTVFSDYNAPFQLELPDGAAQAAQQASAAPVSN